MQPKGLSVCVAWLAMPILVATVVACSFGPVVADDAQPTRDDLTVRKDAGEPPPERKPAEVHYLIVQRPDGRIERVELDGSSATIVADAPPALVPVGVDGIPMADGPMIYVRQWLLGVYVVDTPGGDLIPLEFVPSDASPLAVRPLTDGRLIEGEPLSLAWGVFSAVENPSARLYVSAPDGSLMTEVLAEAQNVDALARLVPWQWRQDGRLYFTKEPAGIGSSGPFAGAANLWLLDPESGGSGVLISNDVTDGERCLDAIAPGAPLVAHHCDGREITLLNLATGEMTVVDLPDQVPNRALLGGVRFNWDGSRIAFAAMTEGTKPATDMRSYVIVSDGLSGGSRIVATSQPGEYLKVVGWLSDDMLVLQSFSVKPDGLPAVWVVGTDGTGLAKLADGTFLG